jgi:hypothetical protein
VDPKILDLLKRILSALPSAGAALQGFTAGLRPFIQAAGALAGALHNLIAAGGIGGVVRSVTGPGVGQAVSAAAGGVGRLVAGATGVASGAGGAGLSGLAAAAGSLGPVALAAAGASAALVALGVATEKTGRTMLETQRNLANASPSMAMVFAQSDIRKFFRDFKAGEEQAGSAGFLSRNLDNLADRLQPITTLLANIANVVAGGASWLLEKVITPISIISKWVSGLFEMVEKFVALFGIYLRRNPDQQSNITGELMKEIENQEMARWRRATQDRQMPPLERHHRAPVFGL